MKILFQSPLIQKLMTRLFLVASLFVSFIFFGQNGDWEKNTYMVNAEDSIAHIQKRVDYIKQVNTRELYDTNFTLADRPFAFEDFDGIEELLKDTIFFTRSELAFTKNKEYPQISKWSKAFLCPSNKLR